MKYVTVEEAIDAPGLRIAFQRNIPVPWTVAIRAILELKGIDYLPVAHTPGGLNLDLVKWTGQGSAPVAVYNDERVRANWSEMLLLAERLAPEPRLIPADEALRVETMGLSYEICGEGGLGWNIRLLTLANLKQLGLPTNARVDKQYWEGTSQEIVAGRCAAVIRHLSERLERQAANGSRFLVGDSLTAADIYWAAFSVLLDNPGDDICPLTEFYEALPLYLIETIGAPVPQNLLEHRYRIATDYFKLPMIF